MDRGSKRQPTTFGNVNGLSKNVLTGARKAFTLASGKVVYGVHTITKYSDLKSQISVHRLNPRIQEDLSDDAVSDIAPSIKEKGVTDSSISLFNPSTNKSEVLEGSRRLWCADKYHKDYPHWKITDDISDEDIKSLIKDFETKKPISYRERGKDYPTIMAENNLKTVDELANYLKQGKETVRKLLQAATIDPALIRAFPDCNGIPNTFYSDLAKIERDLNKNNIEVSDFVKEALSLVTIDINLPLDKRQNAVRDALKTLRTEKFDSDKPQPESRDIVKFADPKKSAVISTSADKRTTTFVLKRMNSSLVTEIEELIKKRVADNS